MAIIAVDFDGTLCVHRFPEIGEIGEDQERVIQFIQRCKRAGDTIILWTCRQDTTERNYLQESVAFCKRNNIPIDYVNENVPHMRKAFGTPIFDSEFRVQKIIADLYVDDKAASLKDIARYMNNLDAMGTEEVE